MTHIELLDKAIELYANGKQTEFSKLTHIKESTLKTWRNRGEVPNDKIVLLTTLIENHGLKTKLADIEQYFTLQEKISKSFKADQ